MEKSESGLETIRWERDGDGVVTLVFDDPAQSANTFNAGFIGSLERAVDRLEAEREQLAGVLLSSAKKTFFAGGDLNDLIALGPDDGERAAAMGDGVKRSLRRLETLGLPVVAVVEGAALGGGLEIALAAHHRVVLDAPKLRLGFPEVTLGLLPGAGGVVRGVRLLGLAPALSELLLEGRPLAPAQALKLGLVDDLADSPEVARNAAKRWIAANPRARQPWDEPGYAIPGGLPSDQGAGELTGFLEQLRERLGESPYPAPRAILAATVEGAETDVESAFAVEGRHFVELACGQVSKNMIQAFFFDLQEVKGDRGRAGVAAVAPVAKAAVLGAGMMGAGIAYVCARAGIEVALTDLDAEAAVRGKGYSEKLLARQVERGRLGEAAAAEILARVRPSADVAEAAGAELVIEAVFEDPGVKAEVLGAVEPQAAPDALLASNTSTLPITELAASVGRPTDFIGLHFFSPVDRMPLLEIIKGERTSEGALDRALAIARQLGKTPIVVNDSRGFFTSRVISTFINEGMAMLVDGVPAAAIERAAARAGYPAPVLQLADELNLALLRRIRDASRAAAEAEGRQWQAHPAEQVVERMIDEAGRAGRAAGAGFYSYEGGRRSGLWDGLAGMFPVAAEQPPLGDLVERMLFVEALESVRCLEEGVIERVADANVGSILGIGYPGWTGGVLQYVDGYAGGTAGFAARARELAAVYGPRFESRRRLLDAAERGEPLR